MPMLDKVTDFLKLARQVPFSLILSLVITLLFIFSIPETTATRLGILEIRTEYKGLFGVTFLLLLSLVLAKVIESLKLRTVTILAKIELKGHLKNLTSEEKIYLKEFLERDVNTRYFNLLDGVILGLREKGIVQIPGGMAELHRTPYNLTRNARQILIKNPSLLDY